jgi:hypothetical protein
MLGSCMDEACLALRLPQIIIISAARAEYQRDNNAANMTSYIVFKAPPIAWVITVSTISAKDPNWSYFNRSSVV